MNIVATIIETLTDFVTGLGGAFSSAFQHLFMVESASSPGTFTGLNDLGVFLLTFLGIGFGYGVIRFIMGLFRRETR